MKKRDIILTPAQQEAATGLLEASSCGNIFVVRGREGMGKTTILRKAHRRLGGTFLGIRQFVDLLDRRHPLALEEAFFQMMREALATNDSLFVDDLHLITRVAEGCGSYPRPNLLNAPLTAIVAEALETGKKLVFGIDGYPPSPIHCRAFTWDVKEFDPPDYERLCGAYLGAKAAARLDYAKIHRFAPKLNAHQLRSACLWLRRAAELDTQLFLEYLRTRFLTSNVDLCEVQPVDLHSLKGVDDVIRSLEASIVLPFENDALATELDLKPKRGVLLAGPPGTGKTTIGRALAHRLKSKFFLIDGTFIAGTGRFYQEILYVFEAAKRNAPSIIFIDDSDVIFEDRQEHGLYRYLLTMLDGLESESAGRVCVVMTAMDVGSLPPAMIRSGRIELWLETRLPDACARTAILEERVAKLPPQIRDVDVALLVGASEGLTGADLKRAVEDGKVLYAYDRANGLRLRALDEYFLSAIETVRANKRLYAEAEARARERHTAGLPLTFWGGNGMTCA